MAGEELRTRRGRDAREEISGISPTFAPAAACAALISRTP
jgi:hypothetical protein